jgi:hypothetical protein
MNNEYKEDTQEFDKKINKSNEEFEKFNTACQNIQQIANRLILLANAFHDIGMMEVRDKLDKCAATLKEADKTISLYFSQISSQRLKEAQEGSANIFLAVMAGLNLKEGEKET